MPDSILNATASFKRWIAHYFFGLFTSSFNNAAIAVDGVIGLAVGAAVTTDIASPTWKTAAAIFGVTFVRSAISYFAKNPLPTKLEDSAETK